MSSPATGQGTEPAPGKDVTDSSRSDQSSKIDDPPVKTTEKDSKVFMPTTPGKESQPPEESLPPAKSQAQSADAAVPLEEGVEKESNQEPDESEAVVEQAKGEPKGGDADVEARLDEEDKENLPFKLQAPAQDVMFTPAIKKDDGKGIIVEPGRPVPYMKPDREEKAAEHVGTIATIRPQFFLVFQIDSLVKQYTYPIEITNTSGKLIDLGKINIIFVKLV